MTQRSPGHADQHDKETVFLADLEACHARARQALATRQWFMLNEIAVELETLSTQLSQAVAGGFTSLRVEQRLSDVIDFFRKALAQASADDKILRQKENDLRHERKNIVTKAGSVR
ncbi:MAG: hypothetical protein WEB07_02015 [Natronospirillum sp.]